MKNMLTSKIKKIFCKYSQAAGISLLVSGSLLLAGCADKPQLSPCQVNYIKFVSAVSAQHKAICAHGGRIIKLGETIRIILPGNLLFNPASANFVNSNMPILNAAAAYMNQYQLENVKVGAYSDHQGTDKLTTMQAQAVASYLWSQGINTRLLHSQGYGDRNKVASNDSPHGRVENRRVEISFRYHPKYTSYN